MVEVGTEQRERNVASTERTPAARRAEGVRAARKSPTAYRTISEVSDELDIPQHVLRFWETKFSQVKPLKRGGGRRYYRPEDITLLRRIQALLYREGYTIKGVQKLLREGRAAERAQAILKDEDSAVGAPPEAKPIEAGHEEPGPAEVRSMDSQHDADAGAARRDEGGEPLSEADEESTNRADGLASALNDAGGLDDSQGVPQGEYQTASRDSSSSERVAANAEEEADRAASSSTGLTLSPTTAAELSAVLDILHDIRRRLAPGQEMDPEATAIGTDAGEESGG